MPGNSSENIPKLKWYSLGLFKVYQITIWISVIAVFVISFLDLIGWVFNMTPLKSIMPYWESMKIITAICLIFTATALILIRLKVPMILSKILPRVLATFILLVSLVNIYVPLFLLRTGNESSLTGISYLALFVAPLSRMSLLTAFNFSLTGCIIFLLSADKKITSDIAHVLIIPVILISYYVSVNYILGVYSATDIKDVSVAFNTGIAFCFICAAILLMSPDTWLLKVFTTADTGGIIARRLLPPLMILPLIIGWLRIKGERTGLFESEEGVILVVITYSVCFLILVWFTARFVSFIDKKRHASQVALKESEQRLKYHLENSPLAVIEWDNNFNIIQWSDEAEKIFGLKKEEVLGVRIDNLNIIYEEDISGVEKTMNRLTNGKELKVVSQNRNYTKNREVIDCIWYNSVLLDVNGQMTSVMSLVEDITTLRKTQKELSESSDRYKELVSKARSIIVKLDTKGNFTFINEFGQDFFGYKEEELLGKSAMDTIVPQTESTGRNLDEMIENIYKDPDEYSININENIKKNGERVWIEWHNKASFDNKGIRTGHIAIGVDITERKKAEEALKESEEKLWSVLNATQESIYMFDQAGKITMSNSIGFERLKNIAENELIGHHFSEFMTQLIAVRKQEKLDKVFRSGKPLEYEDEREGRMYHHNYFPVFKGDKVSFVVTYSTDITDRKRDEAKLKESEDRFRTIAESLPVLISIYRIADSTFSFVNEYYEKTFGYNKGELTNRKVPDSFFYPEDLISLGNTLKESGSADNIEIRVKKSDGTPFWIMTSVLRIMFRDEPAYLTASIDITQTKKAQEELLQLNRTLDAHNKSSKAMMHSHNEINYLNEVCKIIIEDCGHTMVWIGYAQNDKHKSVKPVAYSGFDKGYIDQLKITWNDTERGRGPTGNAIRTGKPSICKNMLTDPDFEPWREEAIKRGFASSIVLPIISEGKPFGAISIYSKEPDSFSDNEINLLSDLASDLAYGISYIRLDESERAAVKVIKENEAKLKELIATKDKFFNIVAHDLKNPFTSLLGSSELLYDNIDKMSSENIRKLALILNDSAKGGYSILQNLLDWSRSQTGLLKISPENINLKDIINENISNLQLPAANKEICLIYESPEDIHVIADKNMIHTVLRNLMSNALKFTRKGGTVAVRAFMETDNVNIFVKDNGVGISQERIEKLFSLDTKNTMPGTENEIGTGLGLKLCMEFVEKMNGKIRVESTENKGSEFKVSIPVNKA